MAVWFALVWVRLGVGARHHTGRALGRLNEAAQGAVRIPLAARSRIGDEKRVATVGLFETVGDVVPRFFLLGTFSHQLGACRIAVRRSIIRLVPGSSLAR